MRSYYRRIAAGVIVHFKAESGAEIAELEEIVACHISVKTVLKALGAVRARHRPDYPTLW